MALSPQRHPSRKKKTYWAYTDTELEGLIARGDAQAEHVLKEMSMVFHFVTGWDNPFLSVSIAKQPDEAWLLFHREGKYSRMYLEIGPETTVEKIKALWPELKDVRRFLESLQGPYPGARRWGLFEQFATQQDQRKSAAAIAMDLNQTVASFLGEHVRFLARLQRDPPTNPLNSNRVRDWAEQNLAFGKKFLRLMGVPDLDGWVKDALENLRNGEPAFSGKAAPITAKLVQARIREWKKKAPTRSASKKDVAPR